MDDKNKKQNINITDKNYEDGVSIIEKHPIFKHFRFIHIIKRLPKEKIGKNIIAYVSHYQVGDDLYSHGTNIYVNKNILLSPKQWAFVLAHCLLHLCFGHFDYDKVPGYIKENVTGEKEKVAKFDISLWNKACDIYVDRFLDDIKFGEFLVDIHKCTVPNGIKNEIDIYNYLVENKVDVKQIYGVADEDHLDMSGLEKPVKYASVYHNYYVNHFATSIAISAEEAVADISENSTRHSGNQFDIKKIWGKAASWFLNNYPLLGGLASAFKIIDDKRVINQYGISIAAIDVDNKEIYVNPTSCLSIEEWKFVLAHEYLHAGLCHKERCQGRNKFLWNVACDYVINGWLSAMNIGTMPKDGLLYDEKLKNMSAEGIYDDIINRFKKHDDIKTFGGYGIGDILDGKYQPSFNKNGAVSLDDFCRDALLQGLEYQLEKGRGNIPAGLVEEIRALAMPVIPWDVELARWFDKYFPILEKQRTYARPSRRQGSTPDIPRPSYVKANYDNQRTFGVVVDTSGSMSTKDIGMALGSIASFAEAKDVYMARVVFCDADAYDAGYMSPNDIAGSVKVKGRGGTVLQPGIDLLEGAKDFPKDGTILIITDGMIEDNLKVKRDHAFLIPKGGHLPFSPKGKVFYYCER